MQINDIEISDFIEDELVGIYIDDGESLASELISYDDAIKIIDHLTKVFDIHKVHYPPTIDEKLTKKLKPGDIVSYEYPVGDPRRYKGD